MSNPIILVTLAITVVCVWMATYPSTLRTRRPVSRARRENDDETDEDSDRLRRLEEHEANVAQLRLAATGRNRWNRCDLQTAIGADPALGDEAHLVWPPPATTGPTQLLTS